MNDFKDNVFNAFNSLPNGKNIVVYRSSLSFDIGERLFDIPLPNPAWQITNFVSIPQEVAEDPSYYIDDILECISLILTSIRDKIYVVQYEKELPANHEVFLSNPRVVAVV